MRLSKWVEMTMRELIDRRAVAAEVDEEMRFHLAMQTEHNVRAGAAPDEARRRALLAFGGVQRHREGMRDSQPARRLERVGHDVRFALRLMRKTPAFSIAAVLTLAVGIGSNTAVFSTVNGVLLHPLPYPSSDRLVTIAHTTKGGTLPANLPGSSATHMVYLSAKSFASIALYELGEATLTGRDLPERLEVVHATRSVFAVLGVPPAIGRPFTPEEDTPGAARVVLISHDLWERRFGADRAVVGRSVVLDGRPSVIIGVMPPAFAFPNDNVQLWMPMQLDMSDLGGFHTPEIGRLRTGVSAEDAERELATLLPRVSAVVDFLTPETLRNIGLRPDVHLYANEVVAGPVRRALWTLWATVALVLLIACVNVASLVAARGESRRREIALRRALGAERGRLNAQSLTESTVLVVLGGVLGIALASVALALLRRFGGEVVPRLAEVRIDGTVLLVTAVISAGAALIFGLVPLAADRNDVGSHVFGMGVREGTMDGRGTRARHALVVAQVAMAAMLLIGCGLMIRTSQNLTRVDLGFRPEPALTFRIALPNASYPKSSDVARFHNAMLERIRRLPGVVAAGATSDLPLTGAGAPGEVLRTDRAAETAKKLSAVAEMRTATPGYFEAMGIPLLRGRVLRDDESSASSGAVVVTSTVARTALAGREPIGAQIAHGLADVRGERPLSEVVGVVGDVRGVSLEASPVGAVYYPMIDAPAMKMDWLARSMAYVVRVRVEPMALLPSIHAFVHELDPSLPLTEVRTLHSVVDAASERTRFAMLALTLAAAAGLLLGSIGLYGMLAFATAQRTREIGVRMALGAKPAAMRMSVLRQGLELCALGIALGLAAAFALRVAIRPMLYEVSAADPTTFVTVAGVLMLVGATAAWIPASRAARLDPVIALKSD